VPGWPAAPVHLCLKALGRCDLLRHPAKFRLRRILRRILRRLPPRTIFFPQTNRSVCGWALTSTQLYREPAIQSGGCALQCADRDRWIVGGK
jgi:hypothetical protein